MDNQRKWVIGKSSPAPTPPRTKPAQMLQNFQFSEDFKWCKNNSSANMLSGRGQGELSSSSVSPQKQRSPVPVFAASQQPAILKYMLGQYPLPTSGLSTSGSFSRYHSPTMVSDKELCAIDVLSSRFMLDRNKGENEDRESVKNDEFSITLPSPEEMIEQFRKGLTVSDKQGREEKKVKKVNPRKEKSEKVKVEEQRVPTVDEDEELLKDGLEVPCRAKQDGPLAKEGDENLVMTGEFGESERFPWILSPRKPNQWPKDPKPCEAVGSSSKLGGKSVAQKKKKIPETISNSNSGTKKGKEKDQKEKREKGKDKGREKGNNTPTIANFSLTLTSKEIVEDFFAMTGRKPSGKFTKWDKTV